MQLRLDLAKAGIVAGNRLHFASRFMTDNHIEYDEARILGANVFFSGCELGGLGFEGLPECITDWDVEAVGVRQALAQGRVDDLQRRAASAFGLYGDMPNAEERLNATAQDINDGHAAAMAKVMDPNYLAVLPKSEALARPLRLVRFMMQDNGTATFEATTGDDLHQYVLWPVGEMPECTDGPAEPSHNDVAQMEPA